MARVTYDVSYTGPSRLDEQAVREEVVRHHRRLGLEVEVGTVEYRGKSSRTARRQRQVGRAVKYFNPE